MGKSDEDILIELNREEAKQYIGGVVFVVLIMVTGFFGNLHVLFVYAFRIKPSNHRIFILTLGVLDFITCVVGMPFIIVDLRNPLKFTMVAACKVLRFVNYFICMSSGLLLVVIAIDRYRKICVPFGKQMSRTVAKACVLVVMCLSMLMSWPAPVLYGRDTIMTSHHNVTGVRCYEEDKFRGTKYMAYFNTWLILVFLIAFIILVVLYALIWRVIKRHNISHAKMAQPNESESQNVTGFSNISSSGDEFIAKSDKEDNSERSTENKTKKASERRTKRHGKAKSVKSLPNNGTNKDEHSNRANRTTIMFFLITTVFLLSYMPHLTLKIVTFLNKDFVPNMSFTGKVLYNTFIWCFFINNMANAFIYGFFDARFRAEVKTLYSNLFCRRK